MESISWTGTTPSDLNPMSISRLSRSIAITLPSTTSPRRNWRNSPAPTLSRSAAISMSSVASSAGASAGGSAPAGAAGTTGTSLAAATSAAWSSAGVAGAFGEMLSFVKLDLPSVAELPRVSSLPVFLNPQPQQLSMRRRLGPPRRPFPPSPTAPREPHHLGSKPPSPREPAPPPGHTTGHSIGVACIDLGGGIFSAPSHPGSIVSATTFHFRVRNGNGWVRRALTTKADIIGPSASLEQVPEYYE